MAKPAPTKKKSAFLEVRGLIAIAASLAFAGILVGFFVWMVRPAAAREVRAACTGLRPTMQNAKLCPKGQKTCRLPQPAPEIEATGYDGKPVLLSALRGKVVLLNFWSSWCGVCKSEKPSLGIMSDDMTSDDFVVLTLSSDRDWAKVLVAMAIAHNPDKVPHRFKRESPAPDAPTMQDALDIYAAAMPDGAPYQVALDPPDPKDANNNNLGTIANRWGLKAVPESFLIDRAGRIRYYFVNKRDWSSSVARTCIQAVIDE
jgi:thiol-disulfide isomerase/thioredoxin